MASNEGKSNKLEILKWVASLLVNILAVAYFVGFSSSTLKQHAKAIEDHARDIKALQEVDSRLRADGSVVSHNNASQIAALEVRVMRIETSLSKMDVLANDMDWLKKWLTANDATVPKPKN